MPLPNAPGHARITLIGQWTNLHPVINILDMRRETGAPSWTATTRDVMNNWQDELVPEFSDNYEFIGAHFIELVPGGEVGDLPRDNAKPHQGTASGASFPPNVTALVRKEIARSRGTRRGRWYLNCITEAQADENGVLSSGIVLELQAALDAFWTGVNDADHHPSVVHSDNSADDITAFTVQPVAATQRRRLR